MRIFMAFCITDCIGCLSIFIGTLQKIMGVQQKLCVHTFVCIGMFIGVLVLWQVLCTSKYSKHPILTKLRAECRKMNGESCHLCLYFRMFNSVNILYLSIMY